jgi:hypothetical protein
VYEGAHWLDEDLDGTIEGPAAYTNGTIDGEVEHRYAVSYRRSLPEEPKFASAGGVFAFAGAGDEDWRVKASISGLTTLEVFEPGLLSTAGGVAWGTTNTRAALPDTILNGQMNLNWRISTDGGVSYFDAGASQNHLYVTGAEAPEEFETVLDISCRNASGKSPDTIAGQREIVDAIWGDFAAPATGVPEVKNVRDEVMTYYANGYATIGGGFEQLVKNGDGRCGGWGQLLHRAFGVAGVPTSYTGVFPLDWPVPPPDPAWGAGWVFEERELGIFEQPGQGKASPVRRFEDHAIVAWVFQDEAEQFSAYVMDPSYGTRFNSVPANNSAEVLGQALAAWENASLENRSFRFTGPGAAKFIDQAPDPNDFDVRFVS